MTAEPRAVVVRTGKLLGEISTEMLQGFTAADIPRLTNTVTEFLGLQQVCPRAPLPQSFTWGSPAIPSVARALSLSLSLSLSLTPPPPPLRGWGVRACAASPSSRSSRPICKAKSHADIPSGVSHACVDQIPPSKFERPPGRETHSLRAECTWVPPEAAPPLAIWGMTQRSRGHQTHRYISGGGVQDCSHRERSAPEAYPPPPRPAVLNRDTATLSSGAGAACPGNC